MQAKLFLVVVFVGELVWALPQFAGGMQQATVQPIMPVNAANLFGGYDMSQHQQKYGQMVSRYGQATGFQPQQPLQLNDIYQQQQMMQQMLQQQRMQQIHPVGNFQPSYGQNFHQSLLPIPPLNYGQATGMVQPPTSHPVSISPSNIPMQIVIGRQLPGPVTLGSATQTSFQTEDQLAPSPPTAQSELPKFLEGAGPEVVDEFKAIIRQPNTSYSEQVKQIDGLVQKLDQSHQELYKQFMKENDDREQQHREKIHQTVAKMSDKAQEQFAKISAVLRNPGVPDQERWDRVLNLYGSMDPELRNEFEQKFKGFGPTPPNYFI